MAKGVLSRSKSLRSTAWKGGLKEDGISAPVLVATDAEPLYNLYHELNTVRKGSLPGLRTAHAPNTPASVAKSLLIEDKSQGPFPRQAYPTASQSNYIHDIAGTKNITIGMAVGSPSQNPLPPLPIEPKSGITLVVDTPPAPSSADLHTAGIEDTIKQKGSWKWFGGFFGKRNASTPASPASAFYQLQPTVSPTPHTGVKISQSYHGSHHEAGKSKNVRSQSKRQETRKDSPKQLRAHTKEKSVKVKPDMQRAHTAPMFQSERDSPTPPPKDYKVQGDSSRLQTNNGPMMLQVDIPNFTMERYSVMFGNVLRPKQAPLLVRRQAQLEKLKTAVGDEHHLAEPEKDNARLLASQRRTTSPQAKSPYFSLFPSAPPLSNGTPPPQPPYKSTPLHRSATVPNASSPMRPTFEVSKSTIDGENAVVVVLQSPIKSSATPASPHRPKWSSDISSTFTEASTADGYDVVSSPQGTRLTYVKFVSPKSSSRTDSVPADFKLASPPAKHRRNPQRVQTTDDIPKASIPDHLKSPPRFHPPTSAFSITGKSKSCVTTDNSSSILNTNPLSSLPPSAAEISVARQISLSRKQRQLLVPIVPKTARQPMQPKFVSVDGEGKKEGEWEAVASRKSHHLVIEDA